ncbi:MAG TPA: ROK family protein [Ktedonobacterales bacterium]|nr:ROK family protein [Ktedonobacterales bacterium]
MSEQIESVGGAGGPLMIGVDLGGTQVRAALVQDGKLLSRVGYLTQDEDGFEAVLARIKEAIRQAAQQASVPLKRVIGIGIGAPGPLDSRTGILFAPPNLRGWHNVPLRQLLYDEFSLPVYLGNDANLAGLGEHMYGAGRGVPDMIYVTVSTGIGGGVIIGGRVLEGVSGTAGEIGHMTIDIRGPRCNCGNIGCLEVLASGTAIARRAAEAISQGRGDAMRAVARELALKKNADADLAGRSTLSPQAEIAPLPAEVEVDAAAVVEAAKRGDVVAAEIMRRAAENVGVGMVNLIHLFNPSLIVIGGGVSKAGPLLFEPVERVIRERAMEVPRQAVRIVRAELGENVGLLGAAANVLQQYMGTSAEVY